MTLTMVQLLGAALFALGIYGVLTRPNAVGILLSVELMANAVNINLVAFGAYKGGSLGQVFALFAIALAVAEVTVGLALIILLHRKHRDVLAELASEMSG